MKRWSHGLLFSFATLLCFSGCKFLAPMMYVLTGEGDIKAEYTGLKEKRVAVVCRPVGELKVRDSGVAKEIAHQVGKRLRANVKKIELVDRKEVDDWCDKNANEDFVAVGKGVKADLVVGIELESFSLYKGADVYRGDASVAMAIYDIKDHGRTDWDKHGIKILYPPNSDISASDRPESEFRKNFVDRVAEVLARHFYDYPIADDFALEGKF